LKCTIGFLRDEVAEALADGTGVTLVVKPELGHTEAAVALDVTATVTGTGTARRYEMQALVTGDALSGLLNGLDEAVFALQVAWGDEGAAGYGISEPLEVVIVNAYVRPGDELPDPTGDAAWELLKDTFPQGTPDEVERTLEFDLDAGGVTDHGALTGLGDDDHPQYLDNARGDARYAPVGAATGTNTGDVTLAGAPNYLTIVGQVITRALINLASHVTGVLGRANGGTGLSVAGSEGNVLKSDGTNWVSGSITAAQLPLPGTTTIGGVMRNTGTTGQFVNGINSSGQLLFETPSGGNSFDQDLNSTDDVGFKTIMLESDTNGEMLRLEGNEVAGNDVGFAVYNNTGNNANSFWFNQNGNYLGIGVEENVCRIYADLPLVIILPTDATNLPSGAIWNDGGVISLVP
jgi:hypothetical protein